MMSDQDNQETAELRTQVILEYMKLGPSIFASTYETFCKPGVTFSGPRPKKRKSQARMSRKWRGRA
jgi:hypothetical protein